MTSLTIATLNAVFQHALPHDVRALQQRVRELEAQRLSPYARADGTMKTWQEVAENLQREVESERSRGEHADLLVGQAIGKLESARARARQAAHGKERDRSETITLLHNMMTDAAIANLCKWDTVMPCHQ